MLYLPLGQWSPNSYPASVAKRLFESIDEYTTHNWAESAEYSSLLFCQFIDFYAVVLCRENHDGSIRTDFIDGAHNRIHAAIFSLRVVIDKCVITACDNMAFVKKLPCIAELMADAETGYAYKGAKEGYILDFRDRHKI